jgi:uncharacterized damage-inducible protein DinB
MNPIHSEFIASSRKFFVYYKTLGEKTFLQLEDEQLFLEPNTGSNSIAVIVQHMVGNMHSRWAGFPNQDGESQTRNRDAEFEPYLQSRAELLAAWEGGWAVLFAALEQLEAIELLSPIRIRGEQISALEAVHRQLAHYAHHVGQIVLLGKMFRGQDWQSLSIPRGGSAVFNQQMQEKTKRG